MIKILKFKSSVLLINMEIEPPIVTNDNKKVKKVRKSKTTQPEEKEKEKEPVKKLVVIEEDEIEEPKEVNEQTENEQTENKKTENQKPQITVSLFNNDCIEEMKKIPNDSVELILCDLPYGSTKCKWDVIIDTDKLWEQYRRILKKPTGVVVLFGQQPFTTKLIAANYDWFKYVITWKKNKTTQFLLANYRPMKCTEDIIVFSPGGAAAASRHTGNMTYNPQNLIPKVVKKVNSQKRIGKMLNQEHHLGKNNKLISNTEYQQEFTNYPKDFIEFDIESTTIHETQKPVLLLEYLVKTYSNEGDTVLDNTMGSGSTGIACINTNRNFIGIEFEKKYFDLAKERLDNHQKI